MSEVFKVNPVEIIMSISHNTKINYTMINLINKNKMVEPEYPFVKTDLNENILHSKLTFIFYFIASIVEGKAIIPKYHNKIDKRDFSSNIDKLYEIYGEYIKSLSALNFLKTNKFDIEFTSEILNLKVLSLINELNPSFCPKLTKVYTDIIDVLNNLSLEELNNEEYINKSLKKKLENQDIELNKFVKMIQSSMNFSKSDFKLFNKDEHFKLILLSENDKRNELLKIITDGVSKLYVYEKMLLNNLGITIKQETEKEPIKEIAEYILSRFDYYRVDQNEYVYPKEFSEQLLDEESRMIEEHIKGFVPMYTEYMKNFRTNRTYNRNVQKIITPGKYPREESVYENYMYANILTYLNVLTVDNEVINKIIALKEKFPHFQEVIDYLEVSIRANKRKNNKLKFKPILLMGNNGIGKSAFINELNKIFKLFNNTINIGSLTTPAEISGSTSLWKSAQPGFISKVIIQNNTCNPIIVLEEMDKVSNRYNANILSPLYDLLEKNSASNFFENFFAVPFDFSNINFIGTANKYENIDKGILNRFRIFNISSPKEKDMYPIVKSVYKELKEDDIYDLIEINDNGLRAIANAFTDKNIFNIRALSKFIDDLLMNAVMDNKEEENYVIDNLDDSYITHSNTVH